MLIAQQIELKPTAVQTELFYRHCAAARIARNDLVALWRAEGAKLPVRGRGGGIRGRRAGRRVQRRLGGVFGVHLLRRGGRTSQNRLSDNIIPLFFGRPAHAGRTLTVKVLTLSVYA